MADIFELDKILTEKRESQEAIPTIFDEEEAPLTDEETESLRSELNDDKILVISDKDAQGAQKQVSLEEYTSDLDKKIVELTGDIDKAKEAKEVLRLVDNGDIKESVTEAKEAAKKEMTTIFKNLAVDRELTDEEINSANDDAIRAIQNYFKIERLDSEDLSKKLRKIPFQTLVSFLPDNFVRIYTTKEERLTKPLEAKDKLLAAIAYLVVTGPEADYLNEFIDRENRLSLVSKELLQCQVDLSAALQKEESMAELIKEAYAYCPKDESFWSKHIAIPNRVHNDFAQRVVLYKHYQKAYIDIYAKYSNDESLGSDIRERALAIIQDEIDDCENKIQAYAKVCDLDILPDLWNTLINRYASNKKTSLDYLYKECINAVERIRKCKQDLPFPGYDGQMKKPEIIFKNYLQSFSHMVTTYNKELQKAKDSDDADASADKFTQLQIDGYEDVDVHTVYAMMVLILMGRVLKHYFKNTMTKYDAIMLDSYFQLFCKMGTDIYIMRDIWNIMQHGLKLVLNNWYVPAKKKAQKKTALKNKK